MKTIYETIFVLVITLAGTLGLLWATSEYGCATTPDSASYLSAARSLAFDGCLTAYDGRPVVYWPPLYSALLAVTSLLSPLTVTGAPRLLGAILYFSTALFFAKWIAQWVMTPWIRMAGFILVASSTTMLLYMGAILSEGLFIFLVILFITVATSRYLSEGIRLLCLCAIASLAVITRYIGITLYPIILLCFFANRPLMSLRLNQRLFVKLCLCCITLIPIVVVVWRNYFLSGYLTGTRSAPMFSLSQRCLSALDITTQFIFPVALPLSARVVGLLLLVGLAAAVCIHRVITRSSTRVALKPDAIILGLILIYPSGLLLLGTFGYMDLPDFRLMSPLLIPIIALLLYDCDFIWTHFKGLISRLAIICIFTFCLALGLHRAVKFCRVAHADGIGMYTNREWKEDDYIKQLNNNQNVCRLFSNAPDAIYLNTLHPAIMLPTRNVLNWKDAIFGAEESIPELVIIAWHKDFWRKYTIKPSDIAKHLKVTRIATYDNFIIYSVETPRILGITNGCTLTIDPRGVNRR